MIKKNFAFLLIYLFFIAIITTACGGGKSNLSDNSTYYYLLSQQNEPMTPTSTAPQNSMTVPISTTAPNPTTDLTSTPESNLPILELSSTKFILNVGETDNIIVTLNGENVTNTVKYKVDEEAIATVEQGVITGLSTGIAIVTVQDDNATVDKTFVVIVIDPNIPNLEVSKDVFSLVVGDTENIIVTLNGTNVTEEVKYDVKNESVNVTEEVKYDVKNESVVKVEKGKITALSEGSTPVTVSLDGANIAVFTVDVTIENPFKNATKDSIVKFGRYHHTAEAEIKPIEWRVLYKDNVNNRLLVISEYAIDTMFFDPNINWSNNWDLLSKRLNVYFYNNAFTTGEKKFIYPTQLLDVDSSGATYNVFLLSKDEVQNKNYFATTKERKCFATGYAKLTGLWTDKEGYCYWWLRSRFIYRNDPVFCWVNEWGAFVYNINISPRFGIRPALWINL